MRRGCCVGVAAIVAVALVVTACSDARDDAASSTMTGPPPTEATTTIPPPTTSTTSTSTTTTSTTTTTTVPEPTLEELEAEVAAGYDAYYERYWECYRSPLNCDTSWLEPGGRAEGAMNITMQGLWDRDEYVGDDPVGYYVIESIEFNTDRTEATVGACWRSTAVLYSTPIDPTRPPGPDNPATVVNDNTGSVRRHDGLVSTETGWLVSWSRVSPDRSSDDMCGGEPS